jgi:hypothetical protein
VSETKDNFTGLSELRREPAWDRRTLARYPTTIVVRKDKPRPGRVACFLTYLTSRYSFVQALVGRSQDSPRMPTPGTNV